MTASRGRRRGAPDTRAQILVSARELFAQQGFKGTSIRAIAGAAGVDPALVHHYFGAKDDLFVAALRIPVDPRELLLPVVAGGADAAGEGLVRTIVGVWDDPAHQPALLALVRGVLEGGDGGGPGSGGGLVGEGFVPVVLGPVGVGLGIDRPALRMSLVASQVIGLVLGRYVLRLEPLASMDAEQVVAAYAPTVQRYLTGDLPLT